MHEKYGDIFQWSFEGQDKEALVFVRDPAAVKKILRETGVSFGKTWTAKAGRGSLPATGSTDPRRGRIDKEICPVCDSKVNDDPE